MGCSGWQAASLDIALHRTKCNHFVGTDLQGINILRILQPLLASLVGQQTQSDAILSNGLWCMEARRVDYGIFGTLRLCLQRNVCVSLHPWHARVPEDRSSN